MRSVLLDQGLSKVRSENFDLRVKLGLPVPESLSDYYEALLKKWDKALETAPKGIAEVKGAEMGSLNKTIANWKPFVYNAEKHPKIQFLNQNDDGTFARPTWKGRKGIDEKPVKGTYVGTKYESTTSLQHVFRSLYTYAICAFLNDNSNFTFPASVKRMGSAANSTNVGRIIDSPVVRFCSDCRPMAGTNEFKLACLGDTVDVRYGAYEFWAIRSRIQFQPRIQLMANGFQKSMGLKTNSYVSILFKNTARLKERCAFVTQKLPLRHYIWLRGNFPDRKLSQLSAVPTEQCAPSRRSLLKAAKMLYEEKAYDNLYLSIEEGRQDEIQDFLVSIKKDYPDVKVIIGEPKTLDEDAADMIVASRGRAIVVNAFSEHSQVVTEFFLLRKKLVPDGVSFW